MSTDAITTFTFPVTNDIIRTYTDEHGNPWFMGMDVCNALNITACNAYKKLDDSQKTLMHRMHLGMKPGKPFVLVSESGLYKLVMRSDKPEAKRFQDWVTKDVLPAIRKDGAYFLGEEKVKTGEMSEDELLLKAMTILTKKVERLTTERDSLQAKVTEHLEYLTVDEWRALNHLYLVHADKVMLGKLASRKAKERGIGLDAQVRRVCTSQGFKDVRVNVYPANILNEVAIESGIIHRLQSAV
jgi:prophage antirepressor-like protein